MQFNITPIKKDIEAKIQHKIDAKTKPIGALGRLESIALQIGLIQQTESPSLRNPHILVFAGDHGIAKESIVNLYPQEVTAQMVYNFLAGGAAINSFCNRNSITLKVIDAGVNHNFKGVSGLIDAKLGYGTKNYRNEPAMTTTQCKVAIKKGGDIVEDVYKNECNSIGFGEMGIGNTSSASLLMSTLTGLSVSDCVGAGTGLSAKGIEAKKEILSRVIKKYNQTDPLHKLATFGGFEIAMISGAILKAAELKMTILIDGFIVTSALLVAHAMNKNVLDYCIFAHSSGEQGHGKMLQFLKQKPLLDLDLRLGEGTGAAVAFPILQLAVGFLTDMASFEDAQVSNL